MKIVNVIFEVIKNSPEHIDPLDIYFTILTDLLADLSSRSNPEKYIYDAVIRLHKNNPLVKRDDDNCFYVNELQEVISVEYDDDDDFVDEEFISEEFEEEYNDYQTSIHSRDFDEEVEMSMTTSFLTVISGTGYFTLDEIIQSMKDNEYYISDKPDNKFKLVLRSAIDVYMRKHEDVIKQTIKNPIGITPRKTIVYAKVFNAHLIPTEKVTHINHKDFVCDLLKNGKSYKACEILEQSPQHFSIHPVLRKLLADKIIIKYKDGVNKYKLNKTPALVLF